MNFQWIKSNSRSCCVAGVVNRMLLQNLSLDEAIDKTLQTGRQAVNVHLIPVHELESIRSAAIELQKRVEETRRAVPADGGQ
ncbi:hypothetical protein Q5741_18880 [Paenibacillus sp. JX-17]|uniref:Uncharacterized protein n=1 Tax=Paenibacillus lacisoli TaxID=3064525 RepID=A0ABT9CIN0_9BACL|nr:hypothetical protein [Paenibacillus sp. JX-17]MDO7908469.1 hypothetical protein [Paenibacillus sp. JX-17]